MKTISKESIDKLVGIIRDGNKITVTTHMNPDGDAFGSSLAMVHYLLEKHSKDVYLVTADPEPESLSFMFSEQDKERFIVQKNNKETAEERINESDVIISLDFNSFARAGSLEDSLKDAKAKKVLIDHHLNPDTESFDLVISETQISSASELLFYVLMSMPDINSDAKNIPLASANSLLVGMTTDTNNFANSVFPTTLTMASKLLEVGVDRDAILSNIYNQYRENRIKLQGYLLDNILKISNFGVAYMILDSETQKKFDTKEGETEGFVNIPLAIKNVRMSIFLKEDGEKVRVSIRSKKGTSANKCARLFFNGGGHENAAGGRLSIPQDIASINDAEQYILSRTEEFFKIENQ